MQRRKTWLAGLSLGAVAASVLIGTFLGRADRVQGCSNLWVNPESGTQECLDNLSVPASATQAETESTPTPRVVGGSRAGAADNPFQVALVAATTPNAFQGQFCGGTLYKNKYVITAASCSFFIPAPALVRVVTYRTPIPAVRNLNPLPAGAVAHPVARIDIHPGYRPGGFDYDVAVWTLTAPVPGGVSVGSLATSDPAVGTPLLATGWGSLGEKGGYPNDLRKVTLPLFSRTDCNDADSYAGNITDRVLCAGREVGGIGVCGFFSGDAGGPLARNNILYGVASGLYGPPCGSREFPNVFARISNATTVAGRPGIRPWIISKTP